MQSPALSQLYPARVLLPLELTLRLGRMVHRARMVVYSREFLPRGKACAIIISAVFVDVGQLVVSILRLRQRSLARIFLPIVRDSSLVPSILFVIVEEWRLRLVRRFHRPRNVW